MRVISALHLRRKVGEMLDRASSGERIVIERDRRPLAMLVSYEDGMKLQESEADRRKRSLAALDRLAAFRRRMAIERPDLLGGDLVRDLRRERQRDDPGSK